MFRPICYWIIFVVLNVWNNMQNISEELWKHSLSSSELVWAEVLLLLLICFVGYYFHISDLVFWPVFKSEYIEEWVRPSNAFIYWCFCFGTEVTKNNGMERFDFSTFLSILLLATCQGLRKTFLFIYLFIFVIFFFLFESSNILSQEDIFSKLYCHKNFFVVDIF